VVAVLALVRIVPLVDGNVSVVVPATEGACRVTVPDVVPEISIALGFRVTDVAIFFLYGVPFATILVADVITPVEDIDAIVVAPYLNINFPPDSSIVKFVVVRELTDGVAHDVLVPSVVKNFPELLVWEGRVVPAPPEVTSLILSCNSGATTSPTLIC
jgi:hypothetical protein